MSPVLTPTLLDPIAETPGALRDRAWPALRRQPAGRGAVARARRSLEPYDQGHHGGRGLRPARPSSQARADPGRRPPAGEGLRGPLDARDDRARPRGRAAHAGAALVRLGDDGLKCGRSGGAGPTAGRRPGLGRSARRPLRRRSAAAAGTRRSRSPSSTSAARFRSPGRTSTASSRDSRTGRRTCAPGPVLSWCATTVPEDRYLNVVTDAGCRDAGLPRTYPLDSRRRIVPWRRCQPIGLRAWEAGLPGVAARSATGPGEELAYFGQAQAAARSGPHRSRTGSGVSS